MVPSAVASTGREAQAVERVLDDLADRKRWRLRDIGLVAFVLAVLAWAGEGVGLRPQ